jgi:uncharacterized SAM-binding protein YcdF (DUF218 family)
MRAQPQCSRSVNLVQFKEWDATTVGATLIIKAILQNMQRDCETLREAGRIGRPRSLLPLGDDFWVEPIAPVQSHYAILYRTTDCLRRARRVPFRIGPMSRTCRCRLILCHHTLIEVGATLWSMLLQSRTAVSLAVIGVCALVVAGFTPVSTWLMLPLENRFPQWQIGPQGAPNGIIALGGESGERMAALAELSQRFPQARLIYSGPGERTSDVEELLKKFARLGGDTARITMESRSRNTFENAVYSSELVRPNPHERWLLVTFNVHMPRAVGSFRHAGFRIEAYPIEFNSGSKAFVAAKEWFGLLVYRLLGRTDALFPAP